DRDVSDEIPSLDLFRTARYPKGYLDRFSLLYHSWRRVSCVTMWRESLCIASLSKDDNHIIEAWDTTWKRIILNKHHFEITILWVWNDALFSIDLSGEIYAWDWVTKTCIAHMNLVYSP